MAPGEATGRELKGSPGHPASLRTASLGASVEVAPWIEMGQAFSPNAHVSTPTGSMGS
ncbi:hypothetical protein Q31a_34550 [Aureliella helgolandensis]|uniref:Uncharacterized protein n=1 Tax=Aureliella helgolandensis TaxID=2527968 RepID=A0A518G982_9BACT|nr:hypothetical protein Q31a_34550 [Aureliella helgolandensis]